MNSTIILYASLTAIVALIRIFKEDYEDYDGSIMGIIFSSAFGIGVLFYLLKIFLFPSIM